MCQKSECGEICYPPSPTEVKLGPYHPEFEWFRFKKVGPLIDLNGTHQTPHCILRPQYIHELWRKN